MILDFNTSFIVTSSVSSLYISLNSALVMLNADQVVFPSLIIAIVLVAATACALLVGCAPKTPVDFMDKWLDSNNKAMVMGDTEISIYGNVALKNVYIF